MTSKPGAGATGLGAPPPAASLTPIVTLVIWLMCLAGGIAGLRLRYVRPRQTPELPPTEIVNVDVDKEPPQPVPPPAPDPAAAPPAAETTTPLPPAPQPVVAPESPPVTPVAAPSPALSFAVPIEGMTRIVDIDQAAHGRPPQVAVTTAGATGGNGRGGGPAALPPVATSAPAPPAIAHLTLGEGEGRQPPPQYPRESVVGHQEGVVTLRFQVGDGGQVTSVEVIAGSRWPLLNQAAVRAVRETWRFPPGPPRTYEVPIQFQLNH